MRNSRGTITRLRRSRGRRAAAGLVAARRWFSAPAPPTPAPCKRAGEIPSSRCGAGCPHQTLGLGSDDPRPSTRPRQKGLHEQIKVTPVVSDYNTKIASAVTAGDAPDFGWRLAWRSISGPKASSFPLTALPIRSALICLTSLSSRDPSHPTRRSAARTSTWSRLTWEDFALEINVKEAKQPA